MGCIIVLLAMLSPRLVIILLWATTNRMDIAFGSDLAALFGFFLLPWATMFWALAYAPLSGVSGIGWLFVVVGVMTDFASIGNSARYRRTY